MLTGTVLASMVAAVGLDFGSVLTAALLVPLALIRLRRHRRRRPSRLTRSEGLPAAAAGAFFLHTKGGRRHKQRAEKGKRNQIKSQRIARAATHEVPSMRSSLICGRMIHGLFGWERIDGEACEASRPCGRIRCRGLLPRGPHASGSYRHFRRHEIGGSPPLAVFVCNILP